MRMALVLTITFGLGLVTSAQAAPATRPATQPSTKPADPRGQTSDQMLGNLLKPPAAGVARPLQPMAEAPNLDKLGPQSVKPGASPVPTLREGTLVIDRSGHLVRSADGEKAEFIFEADGRAMKDPPMTILPNIQLMAMENAVTGANRDLRFRVTGSVTEYKGRNYLLLMKVLVIPDIVQQF